MNAPTRDLLTPAPYDQPPASSVAGIRGHSISTAVGGGMSMSEITNLLQAMREEQMDSLKSISDGVQQLQTQVLLLSEMTTGAEQKTTLCLERLAGVERRVGSIPVPFQPPAGHSNQQAQYGRGSPSIPIKVSTESLPAPSAAPPARAMPPSRPSWMDRSAEKEESSRPHFMRASSTTQTGVVVTPAPLPALASAVSTTVGHDGGAATVDAAPALSAEEAAKEAKRRAFEEDRAKIQARIAAKKAAGSNTSTGTSSTSDNSKPGSNAIIPQLSSAAPQPGTMDSFGRSGSSTFSARPTPSSAGSSGPAFIGGPGGVFSSTPYFLSGGGVIGGADEEDEASRLAKEISAREEAERQERQRKEAAEREAALRKAEEERLEREKEEARRKREEEEARQARELAEARAREEKRRQAEARRQAKTRDIMSSLFDKDDPDDGSSLFGGLGAAVPAGSSVFSEAEGSVSSRAGTAKTSAATSSSSPLSAPGGSGSGGSSSGGAGSGGGGGGSLFAGIPEVGRGGGEGLKQVSAGEGSSRSTFGDAAENTTSKRSVFTGEMSGGGAGSLFDRSSSPLAPATFSGRSLIDVSGAVTGKAGGGTGGRTDDTDGFVGQKKGVFGDDRPSAVVTIGSFTAVKGLFGDTDDVGSADEFLSSPASYSARPSVAAPAPAPAPAPARNSEPSSTLPGETGEAFGEDVEEIFKPVASRLGKAGGFGGSGVGGGSLFDRGEFSIESVDEDGSNVFGHGNSGPSGGVNRGTGGDVSSSFLTALGDAELSLGDEDEVGGKGESVRVPGGDRGMVDVSL